MKTLACISLGMDKVLLFGLTLFSCGCGSDDSEKVGVENLFRELRKEEMMNDAKRNVEFEMTLGPLDIAIASAKTIFDENWKSMADEAHGLGLSKEGEDRARKKMGNLLETLQRELEGPVIKSLETIRDNESQVKQKGIELAEKFKKNLFIEISKDLNEEEIKVVRSWIDQL